MATYNRFIVALAIVLLIYVHSASAAHFLLVHGAAHGAWCWYKLATLLEQAGHNVTAIDLAYSGRNQIPLKLVQNIDGYHQPLYKYLDRLSPNEKVIIVGHSYGGYAVSCAMERFPQKLAGAVFVSAFMVGPNLTFDQLTARYSLSAADYEDSIYIGDPPRIVLPGPTFLKTRFYPNSPPEDYKLANYSVRVTQLFADEISKRQLLVTKERYRSVRRAYFIGGSDMVIPPDVQRFYIQSNPPEVVKEIVGADHMVMFSKTQEFFNGLQEIAVTFNGE